MTGRFRFGKISIGMRVRARIEDKATPITKTITEMGLRSALRRSHIVIALLVLRRATIAETARGHLAPRRRKQGFAIQRGGPARRQSPPARESSARRQHPRESRARPDSARVPAFPWCEQRRAREACSPRLYERRRARLAPCGAVPSSLAAPDRSELARRVRSQLRPLFST